MIRRRHLIITVALAGIVLIVSPARHECRGSDAGEDTARGPYPDDETTRAFLEHVRQSPSFDAQARRFVAQAWERRASDEDYKDFLIEALAVLSARFRDGLDAYQDQEYGTSFAVMDALAADADPYLSANAAVFAAKSLVEQNRLEDAAVRVASILEESTAVDLHTHYAAEVAFLKGYLELQNLRYDQAAGSLQSMLRLYPDAAQRLRVTARQMLAELQRRRPERLGDVADLMSYAGRRMGHEFTDQGVQQKQQRAIDLLDRLIEEAEQNEQGGGGGGAGGGSNGQRSPSSPMQDSQLPGGSPQSEQLRSARRIRPGEAWGAMPPAQREKILQSLRDSFPTRYRQLVEQYYQELAKQP